MHLSSFLSSPPPSHLLISLQQIPVVSANRNKPLISVLTNRSTATSALVIFAAATSNLSTLTWLLGPVGLGTLSSELVVLASRLTEVYAVEEA